jgi:hypothetical protein
MNPVMYICTFTAFKNGQWDFIDQKIEARSEDQAIIKLLNINQFMMRLFYGTVAIDYPELFPDVDLKDFKYAIEDGVDPADWIRRYSKYATAYTVVKLVEEARRSIWLNLKVKRSPLTK